MVEAVREREYRVGCHRLVELGAGWLEALYPPPASSDNPHVIDRVLVPRWSARENAAFPTRAEEYQFARDVLATLDPGLLCDAGAGFNPEIHLFPEIAAGLGFDVIAIDGSVLSLSMPQRKNVTRVHGNICQLPLLENSCVAWVCVSTLEHMKPIEQRMAMQEAMRVLASGGLVVLTIDETEPSAVNELLQATGFQTGPVQEFTGTMLSPRVAWAVAKKP